MPSKRPALVAALVSITILGCQGAMEEECPASLLATLVEPGTGTLATERLLAGNPDLCVLAAQDAGDAAEFVLEIRDLYQQNPGAKMDLDSVSAGVGGSGATARGDGEDFVDPKVVDPDVEESTTGPVGELGPTPSGDDESEPPLIEGEREDSDVPDFAGVPVLEPLYRTNPEAARDLLRRIKIAAGRPPN